MGFVRLFLVSVAVASVSSCATAPKDPNACKVSTTDGASAGEVYIENEAAFYGAGCITGRFGCEWKEATWKGNDIVVEGGLAGMTGTIATYANDQFTYTPPGGFIVRTVKDTLSDGEGFTWEKDKVVMRQKLKGIAAKIARRDEAVINYHFTPTCSKRDVALGMGFLLAGRK